MAKRRPQGVPPSSPQAVGAGQSGRTVQTAGWSAPGPGEPVWYRTNFGPGPGAHVRSMESVVLCPTRETLLKLLPDGATLLEIRAYGLDARIGWHTHLVRATLADGSLATVGFLSQAL